MRKIGIFIALFLSTIAYAEKSKVGVSSNIEGAYIYIDNKKVATIGVGYTSMRLNEGDHTIRVEKTSTDKDWLYTASKEIYVSDNTAFNIYIETKKTATEFRLNRLKNNKKEDKIKLSEKLVKPKTPKVFFRAYGLSIIKTRGDFIRSMNGVVIDKNRKLFWQDSKDVIQRKQTWNEANDFCKSFSLSGIDNWRLPTEQELDTLYHAKKNKIFEHMVSGYIWTKNIKVKEKLVFDTYGVSTANILYSRCVSNN